MTQKDIDDNVSRIRNARKILIVGDAGRGKTTLAHELSKILGLPYHSTDDFYWEKKYTVAADKNLSIKRINEVYKNDKWITEGTTRSLIKPGLDKADIIIYLTYTSLMAQWAVLIKRNFKRDNESLLNLYMLLRHVFYKRYKLGSQKNRQTIKDLVSPYKNKLINLSSFKDIDNIKRILKKII